MKCIVTILCVAALFFNNCSKNEPSVSIEPPATPTDVNILLVIADDIGIEATPGYAIGAVKPNMPNLQSLASRGITFDNAWAYPICSPTRASIISGRYGYRTGVLNAENASTIPASEITLQAYLNDKTGDAYANAIVGKWHLSQGEPDRPAQMGIDYYAGLLNGATDDYNAWRFTDNGQNSQFSGYITTKITNLAIDWIGQQSKPWFCWVAYTAPHTPFHLPPDSMHSQGNLPSDSISVAANPLPYFMAMTESVDFELGRILNSLPQEQFDNTVVIFIGDNGSNRQVIQSPYQTAQSKGSLYQGGVHVPLIVSGAGITRINEREASLVCSTDLFATIAELAGVSLSSYQDSYSFASLLDGSGATAREVNYVEVLGDNANSSGYAIRNAQYKLIQFDNNRQEFYDLSTDAYEQSDLLSGTLTSSQQVAFDALIAEAAVIRN
ncbi:MAG: sulfatase-like hydrolase/transferase [Calditrichia bacterium]